MDVKDKKNIELQSKLKKLEEEKKEREEKIEESNKIELPETFDYQEKSNNLFLFMKNYLFFI